MKALSIRQPWATLIVLGMKTVENRSWVTNYRGKLLIHAAKTITKEDMQAGRKFCQENGFPFPENFPTRGFIGMCDFTGIIWEETEGLTTDRTPAMLTNEVRGYIDGSIGFFLENAKPINYIPAPGRLGLFNPPAEIMESIPA
jgi:hypothetical protein